MLIKSDSIGNNQNSPKSGNIKQLQKFETNNIIFYIYKNQKF